MNATTMGLQRARSVDGTPRPRRRPVRRAIRAGARAPWVGPVMWAVGLTLFVIAAGTLPTPRDFVPPRAASAILVTVAPADTLWSIAATHRLPGASTAETVEAIVDANGMGQRTITAGATLRVPVLGVSDAAVARSAQAVAVR